MSIDKKALIAQISQNVKVPPSQVQSTGPDVAKPNERQKLEEREKPKRTPRKKSKPAVATLPGISTGRQAAFWLDDEDQKIFREVGMSLYAQGIKPSDNLILRAALRLMPTDYRLVEQVRSLLERNGRKLRHQD